TLLFSLYSSAPHPHLPSFPTRRSSDLDVYLAVFRGFIIEGGPETVVAPLDTSSKERQAYSLNKGLDLDGDCRITKEELAMVAFRSEEHTSELQSQSNLVCRLLLEKKKR